ncbi:hypothetical protein BC828DRAFT_379029 [Blastocladiella britannica]|nr:hypothetical protein BC828DRAFT_379029 [Blastocladiella britannica]
MKQFGTSQTVPRMEHILASLSRLSQSNCCISIQFLSDRNKHFLFGLGIVHARVVLKDAFFFYRFNSCQ